MTDSTERETIRFKVRCYPDEAQIKQLEIDMEVSRVVYNLCVEMNNHNQQRQKELKESLGRELTKEEKAPFASNFVAFAKAVTVWKKQTEWPLANEANNVALQFACQAADRGLKNFFAGLKAGRNTGRPRFKRYGEVMSVSYSIINGSPQQERLEKNGIVAIPKTGKTEDGHARWLKINWDRRGLPKEPKTMTIMKDSIGRWFVSFTVRFDETDYKAPKAYKSVGIDVGVVHAVTTSDGDHYDTPEFISEGQKARWLKLQRKMARQQKNSKNREKTRLKIAKYHAKVADARTAFRHNVTKEIINKYGFIAVEDLNVSGMTRAPAAKVDENGKYIRNNARAKAGLNKSVLNVAFGELIRCFEYKSRFYNRVFVKVNPRNTSRTCRKCGYVSKENRRSQAEFVCESCGHEMNADVNAAKNILTLGKKMV